MSVGLCLTIVLMTYMHCIVRLSGSSQDQPPKTSSGHGLIFVFMPLQGGIRQQLARAREDPVDAVADEPPAKLKTHKYGGRDNRAGQQQFAQQQGKDLLTKGLCR